MKEWKRLPKHLKLWTIIERYHADTGKRYFTYESFRKWFYKNGWHKKYGITEWHSVERTIRKLAEMGFLLRWKRDEKGRMIFIIPNEVRIAYNNLLRATIIINGIKELLWEGEPIPMSWLIPLQNMLGKKIPIHLTNNVPYMMQVLEELKEKVRKEFENALQKIASYNSKRWGNGKKRSAKSFRRAP